MTGGATGKAENFPREICRARDRDRRRHYVPFVVLKAEATATVAATPQAVLEYVLDLDRYRQIDPKILRVFSVTGPDEAGGGTISILARMRGMPPAPDKQDFHLERWERLTFTGAARQPSRLIFHFTGVVECAPAPEGTAVTHRYEFRFHGPFRLVERPLAGWLQRQIEQEVQDLARVLS